jgi:hypothetical protein
MTFKWFFKELLLTLSNQKSFFSSKKIERFFAFGTMLLSANVYLWYHIFQCTLTSTDLMIVVGGFLGYAGFSIIQSRKDKTNGQESINTQGTSE